MCAGPYNHLIFIESLMAAPLERTVLSRGAPGQGHGAAQIIRRGIPAGGSLWVESASPGVGEKTDLTGGKPSGYPPGAVHHMEHFAPCVEHVQPGVTTPFRCSDAEAHVLCSTDAAVQRGTPEAVSTAEHRRFQTTHPVCLSLQRAIQLGLLAAAIGIAELRTALTT